jgi:hypothetical protein
MNFGLKKMNILPNPLYSPDLVQRDIFLFHELKMELMQMRFNITNIKAKLQDTFARVHITNCFKNGVITGFTV